MGLIRLAERRLIPDSLIRIGIRRLLRQRLRECRTGDIESRAGRQAELLEHLSDGPIAVETQAANAQHYEVPAEFFQRVLGPRLKYSCCLFPRGNETLAEGEDAMLSLTCRRAEIEDGMRILELGCGWGSLTLWLAEHFPHSHITAVSNSASQREFIQERATAANLNNIEVITANVGNFDTEDRFDRVISVEMFEHMRNYRLLLERISGWLRPRGKLFVHIFTHRLYSYLFETQGVNDWMGRHFFTGGIMPSDDLLLHFQKDFFIQRHWRVSGRHYWLTCEAWLRRQDEQRVEILKMFRQELGQREADTWFQRWRIFFMACAELFRYGGGDEWAVSHYLFEQKSLDQQAAPSVPASLEADH